jgi:hypothetical protein
MVDRIRNSSERNNADSWKHFAAQAEQLCRAGDDHTLRYVCDFISCELTFFTLKIYIKVVVNLNLIDSKDDRVSLSLNGSSIFFILSSKRRFYLLLVAMNLDRRCK